MISLPLSLLSSVPLLALTAQACNHGPGGARWNFHRRAAGAAAGAARTDEASEAAISDATQECTPYSFPAVTAMIPSYPTIWQIATIPSTDTYAQSIFKSLQASIPKIAPKGTPQGDFSQTTPSYNPSDPDCWWSYDKCTTPKIAGIAPDVTTVPEPGAFGYTFDDGPNCSHNAFYDFLSNHQQKATMFYIGSNVMDWPLEAQRGLSDGHEICAHTWSHRYMTGLTDEQAFAELYYSKKAIKDVLGITVQCWRPAFGDIDDRIRYIAQALGMQTVLWVEDINDWNYAALGLPQITTNYNNVITKGTNGSYASHGPIVLTHELDQETMALAQQFYPKIKAAYKNIVPVGVSLNNTKPYLESGFVYPNFQQYAAGTLTVSLAAPTATLVPVSIAISAGQTASVSTAIPFASPTVTRNSAPAASANSGSHGDSSGAWKMGLDKSMVVVAAGVAIGFARLL